MEKLLHPNPNPVSSSKLWYCHPSDKFSESIRLQFSLHHRISWRCQHHSLFSWDTTLSWFGVIKVPPPYSWFQLKIVKPSQLYRVGGHLSSLVKTLYYFEYSVSFWPSKRMMVADCYHNKTQQSIFWLSGRENSLWWVLQFFVPFSPFKFFGCLAL